MELVDRFLQGDRRALARAITYIESDSQQAIPILKALHKHTGKAYIVGITGPPGVGKSTLVDSLTREIRKGGKTIGIIAVDPSSPFTGGALLGDRIRMSSLGTDRGVFFRSMGSRGSLGGLARATSDAVHLLDAFGFDVVMIETVGAGQSEVDIAKTAQTTVVVLVPGLGDEVQAIKAGILEIGNVFVVNKADKVGAERVKIELEMMLDLNPEGTKWRPPIVDTVARDDKGVEELVEKIWSHRAHLEESGEIAGIARRKCKEEVTRIVEAKISEHLLYKLKEKEEFEKLLDKIMAKEIDPYAAAEKVLKDMMEIEEICIN